MSKKERDSFSESFDKKKQVDEDWFGKNRGATEESGGYRTLLGQDVWRERILDSSQRTWRLDDFEKKQFLKPNFFYEFKADETFWSFYKKLIYSVHPEIEEKREEVQKMSFKELCEIGRKESLAKSEYLL